MGLREQSFLGNRSLWEERVPPEDRPLLREQIAALKQERAATLLHRLTDVDGLPLWVCNRMERVQSKDGEAVRGCLVPMGPNRAVYGLDPKVGALFAHKLANQFQILGMILSSLRRSLPASKDVELLQQSVDRAVEFARAFSQYNQTPSRVDGLPVMDVLEPVLASFKAACRQKGVFFREELAPALKAMTFSGDAFSLDLAFRQVLQNALEATEKNDEVAVLGSAQSNGRRPAVTLRIVDGGRGMKEAELTSAATLYFSTKKNHDGVGLSLARRFVELHDGSLRITSSAGKGTEVEIRLPAHSLSSSDKTPRTRTS